MTLTSIVPSVNAIAQNYGRNLPAWLDWHDLANEGLLACWLALPAYDDRRSFKVFMACVARRRMLDVLRHVIRRGKHRITCEPLTETTVVPAGGDPATSVERLDLRKHLRKLSVRDQLVLMAKYQDDEHTLTTARRWHISETRVRQIRAQALRRLRDMEAE